MTEQTSSETEPKWLTDLLTEANDYRLFCELVDETELESMSESILAIAEQTQTILRLREERLRWGSTLLPLPEYIEALAERASVLLADLYQSSDLSTPQLITIESANSYAKLATQINITAKEVILMVRMAFAQQNNFAPTPLPVAFRANRHRRMSQCEEYENHLAQVEADYSDHAADELVELLHVFEREYAQW